MKKVLIAALILVLCGGGMCLYALGVNGFDIEAINPGVMLQREFSFEEGITSISVDDIDRDVCIGTWREPGISVIYSIKNGDHYDIEVVDGELRVRRTGMRESWLRSLGYWESAELMIYVPVGEYERLNVQVSGGDVYVENNSLSFEDVVIHTSSGDVKLGAHGENIDIETDGGDVEVRGIQGKRISIRTSNGQMELVGVTADEYWLETTSGDIECSDMPEMRYAVAANGGDVEVPNDVENGRVCYIQTYGGDVRFR